MTRRSVFVALSLVIAALALAIWWAAGHTSANDAPAVRPDAALQPARDPARSELELAAGEPRDARTMATETTTAGVAANETPNESDRPVGRIRVHIVDAEQRALTRIRGFLGIERDPLTRASTWSGERPAWRIEPVGLSVPRRAWNITIPEGGTFEFECLELGTWSIDCQADGFRGANVDVVLDDVTPQRDVDLVVRRERSLEVSLRTPDGEPFLAALYRAFPQYGAAVNAQLRRIGDRDGTGLVAFTAVIGPARDATYWRTLHTDVFESLTVSAFVAGTLLASGDAPVGVDDLSLVASVDTVSAALGDLSVLVVDDATDVPVAHASVDCGTEGYVLPAEITDENGRVAFTDVLGPEVKLSATSENYAPVTRTVTIFPRRRNGTIVRLERGVTISGTLRRANGQATSDAACLATFDAGSNRGTLVQQAAQRGPTFAFEHVPRGRYVACAESTWRTRNARSGRELELPEPPEVAARSGRMPEGFVYVDATGGSVTNLVLVVPEAAKPR